MNSITVRELEFWMQSNKTFQLIDVREAEECLICSLGGLHIPLSKLSQRLEEIEIEIPKVMLCHHGYRSAQAAGLLLMNEIPNVFNLKGGIHQWAIQIDSSMPTY